MAGQRIALLILPSAVKSAQNPTVTFTNVEQKLMPNGQRWVSEDAFETTAKVRQDRRLLRDGNSSKLRVADVSAVEKGVSQGAQLTVTDRASDELLMMTARPSVPSKLQLTNERSEATGDQAGTDMTVADRIALAPD